MKTSVAIIFMLYSFAARSQCEVLSALNDTTEFEGVTIRYCQVGSRVQIQYDHEGYSNKLGDGFSFPCDLKYGPGIPQPVWKNENFICFLSGCGTSCFSNYLAPLNDRHQVEYAGQFLIDTTNTVFMSLLHDTVTFEPFLELKNHTTGETQMERFANEDFPVAIPIEYLDYSAPHEKGFTYTDDLLMLYLRDERELAVKVKI